jgi:UDP-N-acetylmuramyl pentapeptide phosphotransferase/UDP-N-acetylglucosamine-1-phosphate transferase
MADLIPVEISQSVAVIIALFLSIIITYLLVPPIIKRMTERGITSTDRNKGDNAEVPQLGGIAILFGFPIAISIAAGIMKLTGTYDAIPVLAAIGVLFIGGMFGIIDDISDLSARTKTFAVTFAAMPLMLAKYGSPVIELPFGISIDFSSVDLLFWFILVPIAVTGVANAINLSAGYDGLVTSQVAVISMAMLAACILSNSGIHGPLIFASLFGCSVALNYFCGYPAVIFVGNVGTFSMGAVIAAGVIISGLEFVGIIAIAPAFYEAFAAVYYMLIKKVSRKRAMANPIIDEKGRIHPPKGAEHYTLIYWILSKKPMNEKDLVRVVAGVYLIFGVIAVLVSTII